MAVRQTGKNNALYQLVWIWLQIIACQMKVVRSSYCFHSVAKQVNRLTLAYSFRGFKPGLLGLFTWAQHPGRGHV